MVECIEFYELNENDPVHRNATHVFHPSTNTLQSLRPHHASAVFQSSQFLNNCKFVLLTTFLPVGFPHSVRPEYLEYQAWDCIQGISSYLRSVLTTKSVLQGAGVGSAEATPLAAAFIWVFKDGIGMIGSLFFAYSFSDYFEMYTKEWRLMADVLNNVGLTLDLMTSLFPEYYLLLTSVSTLSKSCCGLLAGATKARISAHLALQGHLADVTAKESTQETAVALAGLLLGVVLAHFVGSDDNYTWLVFALLLLLHQYSNYRLIRVLVFETLNTQRCFILTRKEIETIDRPEREDLPFPRPADIARDESIFMPFYLTFLGPYIGCPIADIFDGISVIHSEGEILESKRFPFVELLKLLNLWSKEEFIIGLDRKGRVSIALQQDCSERSILKAYLLGCFVHHRLKQKNIPLKAAYSALINEYAMEAELWFTKRGHDGIWSTKGDLGSWNVTDITANIHPSPWRYSTKQKEQ